MSVLARGFKTWAEQLSLSIRRDFGLAQHAPLLPVSLAEHLGVQVMTPNDIAGLPSTVLKQLLVNDPDGWSAVSCRAHGRDRIIYNPTHSPARQNSDLSHELAHIILEHEPTKMVLSHDVTFVMRGFDPKQEEEANWLGWSLLLPRTALLFAVKSGLTVTAIAQQWSVSEQLVEFRTRMTGVRQEARRHDVRQSPTNKIARSLQGH